MKASKWMSGNGLEPGVVCVPVNDGGTLYLRCTITDFVFRRNNTARSIKPVVINATANSTVIMRNEFVVPSVPNTPLAVGAQMVLKMR